MILETLISGHVACAQDFSIGVYHDWNTGENYDWDYGLMVLARNGCDTIVASSSYNRGAQFWAAAKHWQIKGIASYAVLNSGTPPDYPIDQAALSAWILSNKDYWDTLTWNGEQIGDIIVGRVVSDEPECGDGMTEAEKEFIRAYCDLNLTLDPDRQTWVNHCDPPWYDLHEVNASASVWAAISVNAWRVDDRITEAQNKGFAGFVPVHFTRRLFDTMPDCLGLISNGFAPPCLPETFQWLESRTNYKDIYEQMITGFLRGAVGCRFYRFNGFDPGIAIEENYAFLDADGFDLNYRMAGFGAAAHAIRTAQGWPDVTLARKISPRNTPALSDRRNYPAGSITLTALPIPGQFPVQQIVFGMSTNGGATWETQNDFSFPYETNPPFTLTAGDTVILRAQAIDTSGQGSIWAANMIYVVDPLQLQCGDYESAMIDGDLNDDCRVDLTDLAIFFSLWVDCDDPSELICNTPAPSSWFCGQPGSDHPNIAADIDNDCDVDWNDYSMLGNDWHQCDDPVTANCP